MRWYLISHLPLSSYFATSLVIVTGILFGLLCLLMFVLESLVKLIAIPFILSFGVASLAYGLAKRKLYHGLKQPL
jgi:hypothetical protein